MQYTLFINGNVVNGLEIYVNDVLLGTDGVTYENIYIETDANKYGQPNARSPEFKFITLEGYEFTKDTHTIVNNDKDCFFTGDLTEQIGTINLVWTQQKNPVPINIDDFDLSGGSDGEENENMLLPFTNIYKISEKELNKLSAFRFDEIAKPNPDGVDWVENPNDPANYINEILRIPYNIETVSSGTTESEPEPEPEPELTDLELLTKMYRQVESQKIRIDRDIDEFVYFIVDVGHFENDYGQEIPFTPEDVTQGINDINSELERLGVELNYPDKTPEQALTLLTHLFDEYELQVDDGLSMEFKFYKYAYDVINDNFTSKYGQPLPVTDEQILKGLNDFMEQLDLIGLVIEPPKPDEPEPEPEPEKQLQNLMLGNVRTDVLAEYIDRYIYDIDLGSINIENHLSKTVGFKNVEIDLHLPNFTKISLDVDRVLGNIINLKLKLNLLTGQGTINIINSVTDTVILTDVQTISEKIPYEIKGVHLDIGTGVIETDYNIPYVEIKTLVPDNEVTLNKVQSIHLSTHYDYLKDDDTIELQTHATEREQQLIKQAIYQGVFIRT